MYSLTSWDQELRRKFYLPYDPYYFGQDKEKSDATEAAMQHLRNLGVFFYRDDDHSNGLLLRPTTPDAPDYIEEDKPFSCEDPLPVYMFNCEVHYPVITPTEWDLPEDRSMQFKYQQQIDKYGDARKWYRFNKECLLRQVQRGMVTIFQ